MRNVASLNTFMLIMQTKMSTCVYKNVYKNEGRTTPQTKVISRRPFSHISVSPINLPSDSCGVLPHLYWVSHDGEMI